MGEDRRWIASKLRSHGSSDVSSILRGEWWGGGVTEISMAEIVLRNFELSGKLIGVKRKQVNGKTELYSLSGYSNSERMVLVQRGRKGGIGNFFVEKTQDKDSNIFYFGY